MLPPRFTNFTFVVLENKAKLKRVQNELPSKGGRELYHFLLLCFNVQISKNMMASQKKKKEKFSALLHIYTFVDDDNKRKVDDSDNEWVLDSE